MFELYLGSLVWGLGTQEGRVLSLDLMIRHLFITGSAMETIRWCSKSVVSHTPAIVLHSANKYNINN